MVNSARELTICDSQPIFELGFDAQLLKPGVDLWSATMDKDRSDAHTGEEDKVIDDASLCRGKCML